MDLLFLGLTSILFCFGCFLFFLSGINISLALSLSFLFTILMLFLLISSFFVLFTLELDLCILFKFSQLLVSDIDFRLHSRHQMKIVLQLRLAHAVFSRLICKNRILNFLEGFCWRIDPLLYELQDAFNLHFIF